ncbi:MAG: hypothetical protein LLG37_08875, partial [Spirochaetia bacterium]|nr:hypothetical protein [Spirochaetia bacterium]
IVEFFVSGIGDGKKIQAPDLTAKWAHNYKGCTSIAEFGGYLYAVDNARGTVYVNDKLTGENQRKIELGEQGALRAVADATGTMYVLTKKDEVLEIDKKLRIKAEHRIKAINDIVWMDIDDEGNFYFLGNSTGTIAKYDHGLKTFKIFAGRNDGPSGLYNPFKFFVSGDNVYVMNSGKKNIPEIKVFNRNGAFVRGFAIKAPKFYDSLSNLAVTPKGVIYLNAPAENKIYKYNSHGGYLGSFNGDRIQSFMINYAASVTGGKEGYIFVYTNVIAVFKADDSGEK